MREWQAEGWRQPEGRYVAGSTVGSELLGAHCSLFNSWRVYNELRLSSVCVSICTGAGLEHKICTSLRSCLRPLVHILSSRGTGGGIRELA